MVRVLTLVQSFFEGTYMRRFTESRELYLNITAT
jgi:hypothetical protein